METITAEYITCVIEAAMTMFFCLYVTRGLLQMPMRILAPVAALLAVAGSAASMALSAWLSACLPFSMDTSTVSLPLWFAVGYFSLRRATHERAGGLLFILLLSVQVLHLCRSTTYFFYGLFLPHMTDGPYCWADIPGFGIPSVVLTFLLAVFCQMCIRDRYITVRIGNKPDAVYIGGFNLFGKNFGDYNQDIVLNIEY